MLEQRRCCFPCGWCCSGRRVGRSVAGLGADFPVGLLAKRGTEHSKKIFLISTAVRNALVTTLLHIQMPVCRVCAAEALILSAPLGCQELDNGSQLKIISAGCKVLVFAKQVRELLSNYHKVAVVP